MSEIKKLYGVNNLELDAEEGKLFIEKQKDDGIEIDLNNQEVMHLLDEFTDEEYGPDAIYGIDTEEMLSG